MQVRKFEANSMKEALELVRTHMGPDAIILAAKDINKSFGLVGDKSVEVTAAVSERTLQKKKFAEQKLNSRDKSKFLSSSARQQKEFIEKVFNNFQVDQSRRPLTSTPYIDIDEDLKATTQQNPGEPSAVKAGGAAHQKPPSARERIKNAVMEASIAASAVDIPEPKPKPKPPAAPMVPNAEAKMIATQKNREILKLKTEVEQLRKLLEGFQKVPQNMMSMHPGAEYGLPYEMSKMFQKLTRSGISVENTVEILKSAKEVLSHEQLKKNGNLDAWVVKKILDTIQIAEDRTLDRYQVFLGPGGQGKTSSLVKLASHMVICEKKNIAIVTTDTDRIGAGEQLKIFSQILNVPYANLRTPNDWIQLNQKLRSVDHILVDTPGLNLKSMAEVDRLRSFMPPEVGGLRSHYVQSLLARDDEAIDIAMRYRQVGVDDVIFTRLDEAAQHGLIYNFHRKVGVPLHSFGIGKQIPEDFEAATKERVVDLIFKLTKVKGKRST